jgi:hypothetical protein
VPPPPVYASIHLVAATFCERRKKQVDDLSFSLSLFSFSSRCFGGIGLWLGYCCLDLKTPQKERERERERKRKREREREREIALLGFGLQQKRFETQKLATEHTNAAIVVISQSTFL